MFINSFLPYSNLIVAFIIPKIKRALDSKFKFNPYITKQTSMQKYKDLYGGNDYVIHFKYSAVLNVCYITMMYGIGMPLLFPIAAF